MAWIEKRKVKGGIAYYVIDRVNGKRICEAVGPNPATAKEVKRKIEDQIVRNQYGLLNIGMTLGETWNKYLEFSKNAKKPKTYRRIKEIGRKLIAFFGSERKVDSISSEEFLRLRDEYMAKRCKNGAIVLVKQIRPFFNYCIERKYVRENPGRMALKNFKEDKCARFLSEPEIEAIRQGARKIRGTGGKGGIVLDIIDTALFTGMRKGEVLGLKRSYLQDGRIVLPTAKNGDPRAIPVHHRLKSILDKYSGNEDVFMGWNADRLAPCWRRVLARARKAGALTGRVRFHDLRHTFASRYLRAGGTIADLRLILGHKSLNTIQIYAHFQKSDLNQKIQNMDWSFTEEDKK